MMARAAPLWLCVIVVLAAAINQPAAAQVPQQTYDGTPEYPGYCLTDWRGDYSCFEGSTRPWPSPPVLPAMAQIIRADGAQDNLANGQGLHQCGAALVAPDWVLTASNCVTRRNMQDFRVRYGVPSVDRVTGENTAVVARILEVVPHPAARAGRTADLALVRFEADPRVYVKNPLNSFVPAEVGIEGHFIFARPAEALFPQAGSADLMFVDIGGRGPEKFDNARRNEFGWRSWQNAVHVRWNTGLPQQADRLAQEPVFLIPPLLCNNQRDRGPRFDEQVICALSHDRPLCPADTGTPVLALYEEQDFIGGRMFRMPTYLVVGVTSFDAPSCDAEGTPGRFTLTAPYRDWMREVMHESYAQRMAESEIRNCQVTYAYDEFGDNLRDSNDELIQLEVVCEEYPAGSHAIHVAEPAN